MLLRCHGEATSTADASCLNTSIPPVESSAVQPCNALSAVWSYDTCDSFRPKCGQGRVAGTDLTSGGRQNGESSWHGSWRRVLWW